MFIPQRHVKILNLFILTKRKFPHLSFPPANCLITDKCGMKNSSYAIDKFNKHLYRLQKIPSNILSKQQIRGFPKLKNHLNCTIIENQNV